jgi:hypothetical protein
VARNYDHLLPNLKKASAAQAHKRAHMTKEQRRAETAAATKASIEWHRRASELMAREKAAREGDAVK